MKRTFLVAVLIGLFMSGSAFAASYGSVYAKIHYSDGAHGTMLDYDAQLTGVSGITYTPNSFTENFWYETFCVDRWDGVSQDSTYLYDLVDLADAPDDGPNAPMGPIKAMTVKKLIADAYHHDGTKYNALTVLSDSSQDVIWGDNNYTTSNEDDYTVGALQLAIWDTIYGPTYYTLPAAGDSTYADIAHYMLANIGQSNKYADAFALTNPIKQDYAILLTGGFQEVPEPGTLVALCGLGLMCGVAACRRRKSRPA